MNHCYLIDSSIYIFRAWFVIPDAITDRQQRPVNALHGFAEFLYEFVHHTRPQHLALAFDESLGQCIRRRIYPLYKAHRPPAPESLKYQFQLCRQLSRLLGITELADGRYEADDIIGTLAARARASGQTAHILTGDKDLTQLINEGDSWWDYARNRRWSVKDIKKNWGVRPDQIADLLALAGDKVDNIPGIPGVGAATAARLLNRFDNLDALLAQQGEIGNMKTRGAVRLQALVTEHQNTVKLARQLTGIFCDVPLPPETTTRWQWRHEQLPALEAFFDQNNLGARHLERWRKLLSSTQASSTTSEDCRE